MKAILPLCRIGAINRAMEASVLDNAEQCFDFLYPLCNPHQVLDNLKKDFTLVGGLKMLTNRMEQERLRAVLQQHTKDNSARAPALKRKM